MSRRKGWKESVLALSGFHSWNNDSFLAADSLTSRARAERQSEAPQPLTEDRESSETHTHKEGKEEQAEERDNKIERC